VVCTVGNAPHPVIKKMGAAGELPVERGKVLVTSTGQVIGLDRVWAAGDCCLFPLKGGGCCPETAQFAYRQGQTLGDNIAATLRDQPLKEFTFKGLGELASIGHRTAVAQIMGVNFSGMLAWFMWRTIYLMKLPGLDRKLRVMTEWTFELLFPRDINLLTPAYSSSLEEMHLEPGDVLFESGDPAFSLYAVKDGKVEIRDEQGQVVKACAKGDHFGERALLGDRIWRFDAVATQSSTLVAVDADTFVKLVTTIGSLGRLFRRSAETYHLQEEVDQTVAAMSGEVRAATAADVMTTAVTTLSSEASLDDALQTFQSQPHSSYPVVNADGKVLGLLRRAAAYDYLKHNGLDGSEPILRAGLGKVFYVRENTPVPELIEDLMRTGASKAVVVDAEQRLLGMVTLFDLVTAGAAGASQK
jgi:NADH dehydrogenase